MARRNGREREDRTERRIRELERRILAGHSDRETVIELAKHYDRAGSTGPSVVTKEEVFAWLQENRVGVVEANHRATSEDDEGNPYFGGGDPTVAEDEVRHVIWALKDMTRVDEIVGKNRRKDQYFRHIEGDAVNAIFLPMGWVSETGEWVEGDEYGERRLTTRAWGPINLTSNDADLEEWALQWPLETLAKCEEITEEEARKIHPALFEHLARLDANGFASGLEPPDSAGP